jgi:hypothetical protein
LFTSLLSTIYSRIGDPPSASGGCQASVKEVSDIPDTSNGPRGGDGLSGTFNILFIYFLMELFFLCMCPGTLYVCHIDENWSFSELVNHFSVLKAGEGIVGSEKS